MKKVMSKLGFVLLCIAAFFAAGAIAFFARLTVIGTAPYKYVATPKNDQVWRVENDLDSGAGTKYDLYLPAQAEDRDYAMILFTHGGGFTVGDKEDGARILPYYAARGIIGVSANYSLMSDDHPVSLNQMFDELRTTLQTVKDYCAARGYHITEMATTGESAGGCLAMLMAYREQDTSPVPAKFVFQQSGPATMDPEKWGASEKADQAAFVNKMAGGTFTAEDVGSDEYLARIKSVSAAELVDGNTVPSIIAYGPRDIVVPPNLKYSLIEKLDEYGVSYQYFEFPNSGHGLLHDPDWSEKYFTLVDQYIEKYFETEEGRK